jgi:hypothetical protein
MNESGQRPNLELSKPEKIKVGVMLAVLIAIALGIIVFLGGCFWKPISIFIHTSDF